MDELETRLTDDLRSAADSVVAGASLDAAVDAGRKQRARRQRVLMTGAALVAVLAAVVGVLAFTGDEPTAVETVGEGEVPTGEIWSVTSPAPIEPRVGFVSTWTGEEMLVWGGQVPDIRDSAAFADGAAYDPDTDTWRTLPAPPIEGRTGAVSAWTGEEWVIIGGSPSGGNGVLYDGAAYDPDTRLWRSFDLPFSLQAGQGSLISTPHGLAAIGVYGRETAFLASNAFLFDPTDLSDVASQEHTDRFEPLPPLTADHVAAVWDDAGSTFYASGVSPECARCLWTLAIDLSAAEPVDAVWRTIEPLDRTAVAESGRTLLWADGVLVGDGFVHPASPSGEPPPRSSDGDVVNPVWTGKVVVGASSNLGGLGFGDGTTNPPPELNFGWWQYDPSTHASDDLPDPPDPLFRRGAQAVMTDEEVLIWGGAYCSVDGTCAQDATGPVTGLRLRPPPFPSMDSMPPTTTGSTVPTTVDDDSTPLDTDPAPTTVATTVAPTSEPSDDVEEVTLAAAGTSFGMCGGYCQKTLTFTGTTVELVAMGWPDQPGGTPSLEWSAQATLTDEWATLIRIILLELNIERLEETYGCPDCADGGAAWIELDTPEGLVRSTYEYGGPPEDLDALDLLMGAFIDSIAACEDSMYLIIDPSCTPLPDP